LPLYKVFTFRVELADYDDLQATVDSAERAGFKIVPIEGMDEDPVTAVDIDGNELTMGRFVLDWWKRGGDDGALVVNLREDVTNHLSREWDLPPDYCVILTDHGGDVMFDLKDIPKDKAEWFLEKVTCGDIDKADEILELGKESGGKVVSKMGRDGRYNREILWKPFRSRYYNPPTEDGLSVNPAPEEFKKIKKVKQSFEERVQQLKEIYGDAYVNAIPEKAFHTQGSAQRANPFAAKKFTVSKRVADLKEALLDEPADEDADENEPAKEPAGKE
jgi:hypothetical protein